MLVGTDLREAEKFLKISKQYARINDFEKAIKYCKQSIDLGNEEAEKYLPELCFNGAKFCEKQKHFKKAVEFCQKSIDLGNEEAKKYLPKLLKLQADEYSRGGLYYYRLNNYSQAIECYTQAIKINPNFYQAYNNRGKTYYNSGEYDRAIEDYTQAITINPRYENEKAYKNRGLCYQALGRNAEAAKDFAKAEDLKGIWDLLW